MPHHLRQRLQEARGLFDGQFVDRVTCYSLTNPGFCYDPLMDALGYFIDAGSVLVTTV